MNRDRVFILSEVLEARESGFTIWNPDFDEFQREFMDEEKQLAERLSQFGIEWEIPGRELDKEAFQYRMKEAILDPFIYENCLHRVLVKDNQVSVQFSFPGSGSGRKYWANFPVEEVESLPVDLQKKLVSVNPYVLPHASIPVDFEEVRFFKSDKKIYVKFVFSSIEVVYSIEENRNVLSVIKSKFDLHEEVEEAWEKFKDSQAKKDETFRAVKRALRIFKKELPDTKGWFQYTVKFSEKVVYIFKPRLSHSGEVYYSVFKIIKGDPQMGLQDKVEGLFSLSTDKFIKEWEDLLERRK